MAEIYQFPRRPALYGGDGMFPDPVPAPPPPSATEAPSPGPGEVNHGLVRALEHALELARSGKLQCFVGVGWMADGAGRFSLWAERHQNVYEMYGSIAMLPHEYLARHREIDLK